MKDLRLMQILLKPHTSEKTSKAGDERRQFAFKVIRNANKEEIKQAIEFLFKVQVKSVQIINVKGKPKGIGRTRGKRSDWKKAYVGLKEGFDINFATD